MLLLFNFSSDSRLSLALCMVSIRFAKVEQLPLFEHTQAHLMLPFRFVRQMRARANAQMLNRLKFSVYSSNTFSDKLYSERVYQMRAAHALQLPLPAKLSYI